MGPSPYLRASRESARAYKSIEHVVQCDGSGIGGCNVDFVVTEDDVDVLEHHRTALADAGWRVVEDNGGHLRAERGRMAFELALCRGDGGEVWAGRDAPGGEAHCHDDGMVGGDTWHAGAKSTGQPLAGACRLDTAESALRTAPVRRDQGKTYAADRPSVGRGAQPHLLSRSQLPTTVHVVVFDIGDDGVATGDGVVREEQHGLA